MNRLLKPLLIVLAVPVLATALGLLGRGDWDSRWRAGLVRQMAAQHVRPDAQLLARYSLSTLCSDRRVGGRLPACHTYDLYSAAIAASAVVGGSGLVFLGVLLLAGYLCGVSRRRLGWLFRPSLVFSVGGTAVLAAANALLAGAATIAGAAYFFGGSTERGFTSVVLVAGTPAAVWAVSMVVVALGVTRRSTVTVVGQSLEPSGQHALVDEVRRVAEAVGADAPANFVACLAPWFFVTEARVACLDGVLSGRTLCLSLPLCRLLSGDEFRALLAHELGHFSGAEERFARRVVPFYIGAARAMDRLVREAHGIRRIAVMPPVVLLSLFMDGVRGGAEPGIERELLADRQAAAITGPDALGAALVKAHAFAPAWHAVAGAMQDAVASGTQYVNSSLLFQEVATSNAGPERLAGVGQHQQGHPTDLHPTLARRLAALDIEPSNVAAAALVTAPPRASILLVEAYEALERRLSATEHQLIADHRFR